MTIKPIHLGPFLGVNNRRPRTTLVVGGKNPGAFMADAVNVDAHSDGVLRTREGFTRLVSCADAGSYWNGYFVDGGTLKLLTGSITAPVVTSVLGGLTPGLAMSYTKHGDRVYAANRDNVWQLDGASATVAGVPMPSTTPVLALIDGSLTEGWYQVSVAYADAAGAVSGATQPEMIYVSDRGGIHVSAIPSLAGFDTRLFMSAPNGTTLYRTDYISGSTYDVRLIPDQHERLYTLNKVPLPGGDFIRSQWGRLIVARDNVLYYTEPWSMLHNPLKDFVQLESAVTMIESCGADGCYVSTEERVYWLPDPASDASVLRQVLPYPAIKGTSGVFPDGTNERVFWTSTRGFVIGTPDGQVANIQEESVAVKPATVGATLYREQDGIKQLVSSTFNPSSTVMAASTFMDAEVVHTRSTS